MDVRLELEPATDEVNARGFARLYRDHFDYVWQVLRRFGGAPRELPDWTHDVFMIAWKQREELGFDRPLRPWLFGVAFRVAAAHRRRAWFRRTVYELNIEAVDPRLGPEQAAVVRAELLTVDAALAQVPLKQRAVLLLHDFDEVAIPEAAEALGIPQKSAYSRLSAARKRFRQAYRQLQLRQVGTGLGVSFSGGECR